MPFLLQFLWSKHNEHAVLNSFSKCPCESYWKKMHCFLLNFLLAFTFLDFSFCCYFLMKMHSLYLFFLFLRRIWSSGRRSGLGRKSEKKRKDSADLLLRSEVENQSWPCYVQAILCLSYFNTRLSILHRQGDCVAQQPLQEHRLRCALL